MLSNFSPTLFSLHMLSPTDHWVSKEEYSRSGMRFSHQRFTFTVARNSSNVILNVVLPFMLVTSLTGVAFSLGSADSRLQVILTIFMSAVGLRYVSSHYIPKVPYATFLDQYMWACLLFIAAAALITVLSASLMWSTPLPSQVMGFLSHGPHLIIL